MNTRLYIEHEQNPLYIFTQIEEHPVYIYT